MIIKYARKIGKWALREKASKKLIEYFDTYNDAEDKRIELQFEKDYGVSIYDPANTRKTSRYKFRTPDYFDQLAKKQRKKFAKQYPLGGKHG